MELFAKTIKAVDYFHKKPLIRYLTVFWIRLCVKLSEISRCTWQKQPPEVFYKKGVLKNFAKFTGKHLCQTLFFNKVAGRRCSVTKGVLRNFAKFTGKHLCQTLFLNKVTSLSSASLFFNKVPLTKKRLWHRCFPVNFTKF